MGFEVHDYAAGKADWLAHGLPREGERAGERRAVDLARDDVATCAPGDRVGEVRARVAASPHAFALVLGEGRVLLGRLGRSALEGDPAARAADAMDPGPSTVRADVTPDALAERMRSRDRRTAIVTTPGGVLIGVVRRADVGEEHPAP